MALCKTNWNDPRPPVSLDEKLNERDADRQDQHKGGDIETESCTRILHSASIDGGSRALDLPLDDCEAAAAAIDAVPFGPASEVAVPMELLVLGIAVAVAIEDVADDWATSVSRSGAAVQLADKVPLIMPGFMANIARVYLASGISAVGKLCDLGRNSQDVHHQRSGVNCRKRLGIHHTGPRPNLRCHAGHVLDRVDHGLVGGVLRGSASAMKW